jgi:hypothetical protein
MISVVTLIFVEISLQLSIKYIAPHSNAFERMKDFLGKENIHPSTSEAYAWRKRFMQCY